jgi:hypothetical protein
VVDCASRATLCLLSGYFVPTAYLPTYLPTRTSTGVCRRPSLAAHRRLLERQGQAAPAALAHPHRVQARTLPRQAAANRGRMGVASNRASAGQGSCRLAQGVRQESRRAEGRAMSHTPPPPAYLAPTAPSLLAVGIPCWGVGAYARSSLSPLSTPPFHDSFSTPLHSTYLRT